jgi:hydroxymethylpyrimidine pyrophosphatase-like HAD family hydrolase
VLPEPGLFNLIVAENGGVVYDPNTGREQALAPSPPASLVQKLMERKVEPISVGRTIVATWLPHDAVVLSAIEELGLELEIIFNKGAVMVLPTGVNKATGLKAALGELGLSPVNVVAVGDAENDHAFLKACGCSAAVANALPAIKDACDISLSRDHGAGVAELITRLIHEDAHLLPASRLGLLLGVDREGERALLQPQESMLIVGGSGSGRASPPC